jgi:hypothetical protein
MNPQLAAIVGDRDALRCGDTRKLTNPNLRSP